MRFQSNKSEKQTAGITYFTRDRDLGQTFTTLHTTSRLDAITIRTGPVPGSVKPGARGARISLQFFEVTGEARILDNGTTTANSNQAGNQWTQDPRADDKPVPAVRPHGRA
jgi:hypothetical protein